jgi:hypothetical protein
VRRVLAQHDARAHDIEFVAADLSLPEGWDAAVKDCEYVQHVASPFPAVHPKDEMELIRPARDGAIRVLRAAKAERVKRVVLTSSMAAIAYGHGDKRADVSDETMWSNVNGPDNTPYTKSKTIAEQAAWDYAKGHSHNGEGMGLELATINPTGILGPALSADVSTSLEIPIRLLNGKTPGLPRIGFSFVDVRDVADCHVRAMELPEAAGERLIQLMREARGAGFSLTDDLSRHFFTPLSALSTANGTRISPSHSVGLSSAFGRIAYCHRPLRLVHSLRTICGRGYSCHAFSGVRSFAHRVSSGPSAGFHSAAEAAVRALSAVCALAKNTKLARKRRMVQSPSI